MGQSPVFLTSSDTCFPGSTRQAGSPCVLGGNINPKGLTASKVIPIRPRVLLSWPCLQTGSVLRTLPPVFKGCDAYPASSAELRTPQSALRGAHSGVGLLHPITSSGGGASAPGAERSPQTPPPPTTVRGTPPPLVQDSLKPGASGSLPRCIRTSPPEPGRGALWATRAHVGIVPRHTATELCPALNPLPVLNPPPMKLREPPPSPQGAARSPAAWLWFHGRFRQLRDPAPQAQGAHGASPRTCSSFSWNGAQRHIRFFSPEGKAYC